MTNFNEDDVKAYNEGVRARRKKTKRRQEKRNSESLVSASYSLSNITEALAELAQQGLGNPHRELFDLASEVVSLVRLGDYEIYLRPAEEKFVLAALELVRDQTA